MHASVPAAIGELATYIERFLAISGREAWFKRTDQLSTELQKSFYLGKIVADYHWLEMAISFQANVLAKEGRLAPESVSDKMRTALNFAAATVEIHSRLSPKAKLVLEGRLRDALKAETGFASLYQEFDLSQRLMDAGYDVDFTDMEGAAQYDLSFSRGAFTGEVECKSLSADAGRQIHRKDFYRFMNLIEPTLNHHSSSSQHEVLVITLESRLPADILWQMELAKDASAMLGTGTPRVTARRDVTLERIPLSSILNDYSTSAEGDLGLACKQLFGSNSHIAGGLTELGGCLVVMRSKRDDDTSKPLIEAMRKAANQLSRNRPGFIAIQDHDIEAADLMSVHLRRRAAILSHALFGHYGASHVNATYFTGFGIIVNHSKKGLLGTPAFSVPNPSPKFPVEETSVTPFLESISTKDYAAAIGCPLPKSDITFLPL